MKERRKHKRHGVKCPIRLLDGHGQVLCQAHTADVSDGGAFLATDLRSLPGVGAALSVRFSLPRTTPNTRMLEDISCEARVVRHQRPRGGRAAGLAIRFTAPLDLMIEV